MCAFFFPLASWTTWTQQILPNMSKLSVHLARLSFDARASLALQGVRGATRRNAMRATGHAAWHLSYQPSEYVQGMSSKRYIQVLRQGSGKWMLYATIWYLLDRRLRRACMTKASLYIFDRLKDPQHCVPPIVA